MTPTYSLAELGWSPDFQRQLETDESATAIPARITTVHRNRVEGLSDQGPLMLSLPPGLSAGAVAVGDWALTDGKGVLRLLDRRSTLARRAAGTGNDQQLIAANLDTLFIVTSCNADFNLGRLERYLALASGAEVQPVILLTKADSCANPEDYRAQAQSLSRDLLAITLDARAPDVAEQLAQWCRKGQTVALLGSSGVGKSTLANSLSGAGQATQAIREDDAKGRHTTTARHLLPMANGGWLIDTPGMRELRLNDAAEGIAEVFDDLSALATQCRFTDCRHVGEPGCAIGAALKTGQIDAPRLARWEKLLGEERHNAETLAQSRKRNRDASRMAQHAVRTKAQRRRDD